MEETNEVEATTESSGPTASGMGTVRGVPSENVQGIGVLDLRGVSADELLKLKSVKGTGAILIDSGQKSALTHCKMEGVGAVVELAPDERLITQPILEVTKATIGGMSAGQKFTMLGVLSIDPDVPAAAVQEKIEFLRLIGVLIASESVVGALFGKLDLTGVTIALKDGEGPVVRNMGLTTLTAGYLSRLTPGSTLINMGKTDIASDVTEELLAERIARYHNLGLTIGPKALMELLQARCGTDAGKFQDAEEV